LKKKRKNRGPGQGGEFGGAGVRGIQAPGALKENLNKEINQWSWARGRKKDDVPPNENEKKRGSENLEEEKGRCAHRVRRGGKEERGRLVFHIG